MTFCFSVKMRSSELSCQGGIWWGLMLRRAHWLGLLMLRIIGTKVICDQAKEIAEFTEISEESQAHTFVVTPIEMATEFSPSGTYHLHLD